MSPADTSTQPRLDQSWLSVLGDEFDEPYMRELSAFLRAERAAGHVVYPPAGRIFAALDHTPFDVVRVVVIGQDPYHGPGQANGLAFSVADGVAIPPSLRNMYRELADDCGVQPPASGNLEPWADQGVLLLNTTLTVGAGAAGSHHGRGWERFTDRIVRELDAGREGLVFLLWGRHAQTKGAAIDRTRHHVLTAAHPSPLSAHNGFFGCKHFSRVNELLAAQGETPIEWSKDGSG